MGERSAPRRAPGPGQRQRDADRSRQRLLDAAMDEFSTKGYGGARVQDIADRAGVNKQLITYYFGGKEGLYRALQEAWLAHESGFAGPEVPLDALIGRYLHAALADPRAARLMIWDALAGDQRPPVPDETGTQDVADMRRRQAAGEIPADLDPALFLLAVMGAIMAPAVLPQIARRMGIDPAADDFEAGYTDLLQRLVRHLRAD